MIRKNMDLFGSHLSEAKIREIFRCFALDMTSTGSSGECSGIETGNN
jgi:hypothetical protein